MRCAVCTIVAKNYLAHARVLMASVRAWMPEARRVVVLADQVDGCFDPAHEDFEVIPSSDLRLPRSAWFHFKYSVLELSTAVKPYALEFLLRRYELDRIIYLDPDIRLYSNPDEMWTLLGSHSIVLTPHLTAQIEDGCLPGELDILRSGAYNLGFIALAATPVAFEFLKWWQRKLYDDCVVDLARGLFVDQRWVDLVPGLFDGVAILRHPGYNVAYWNLKTRAVKCDAGACTVNGQPLRFFHFSGFNPRNPTVLSKYQDRLDLATLGDAATLFSSYAGALLQAGHSDCQRWPYAYGAFRNGVSIPDTGRPLHREVPGIEERVADPFSDEGFRIFRETWNEPLSAGVTRLSHRIYCTRPEMQSAMPDIFGGDYRRFLQWLLDRGRREHNLSGVFLAPVWDAVQAAKSGEEPPSDDGGPGLTRLERRIYESRPDLQRRYSHLAGRDRVKFLVWMLTYGRHEYALDDALLAPLREQWRQALNGLPWLSRWGYRLLLRWMAHSAGKRR